MNHITFAIAFTALQAISMSNGQFWGLTCYAGNSLERPGSSVPPRLNLEPNCLACMKIRAELDQERFGGQVLTTWLCSKQPTRTYLNLPIADNNESQNCVRSTSVTYPDDGGRVSMCSCCSNGCNSDERTCQMTVFPTLPLQQTMNVVDRNGNLVGYYTGFTPSNGSLSWTSTNDTGSNQNQQTTTYTYSIRSESTQLRAVLAYFSIFFIACPLW